MSTRLTASSFDSICRLCLQYSSDYNPLFPLFLHHGHYGRYAKDINESIPEIISACVGLKVDPKDGLPLNICSVCEESLTKSHTFRNQCIESNTYLQQMRETKPQVDSEYDSDDETPLTKLKNTELVLVDSIKEEEKHNEADEYMDYDSYDDSHQYEELTVEPLPVLPETKTPVKVQKTPKHTITKPLVELKKPINTATTTTTTTTTTVVQQQATASNIDDQQCTLKTKQSDEPSGSAENTNETLNVPQAPAKRRNTHKLPKQCTVCGLIVTRLRDHMKSHPEQMEYKCTQCPRSYLTQTGLDRHIDVQHADDRWPLAGGDATKSQRVPRPHLWKQNVRKRLRQTGQPYVNSIGMVQLGRTVRDTCPSQCIWRCQSKFDDDDRVELHRLFWSLPDSEKLTFYAKYTSRHYAARKRTKREHSRRKFSYIYFFDSGEGRREQVCQKFFLSTLDISKGRVYHYFKTKNEIQPGAVNDGDAGPVKKRKRRGRLNDGTISSSRLT